MGASADEVRDAMGEAARKLAGALLAGDDHGAEAYRERLRFLRSVAARHALPPAAGTARTAARQPLTVCRAPLCRAARGCDARQLPEVHAVRTLDYEACQLAGRAGARPAACLLKRVPGPRDCRSA
jgi:hypothetical protein